MYYLRNLGLLHLNENEKMLFIVFQKIQFWTVFQVCFNPPAPEEVYT